MPSTPGGLVGVKARSRRPRRTRLVLDAGKCEQLQALSHECPRTLPRPGAPSQSARRAPGPKVRRANPPCGRKSAAKPSGPRDTGRRPLRSQPSMRRERGRRHARAGHPPPWPAPASRCRAGENASLACHHRGALNVVRLGAWWLDTPRPKRAARPSPLCGGPLPKVTSQLHSLSMSVLRRRAWARAVARRRTPSRMAGIGTDAYPSSSARCSDGSI
jgi:hypothetical protein